MILQNAAALSLLAFSAAVVFLYFLRAHNRRYDVSALFLWEGLYSDPHSRAARIRRKIEPLLLIQLAILALIALTLAAPMRFGSATHVSGLVIVIDGSASMQTVTQSGKSRYDAAREQAEALLDQYPTSPVTLIQFSSQPQVLAATGTDHDQARRALSASRATLSSNGDTETLVGLLDGQRTRSGQERIVYLSDRPLLSPIPNVEEREITGGMNTAITGFNVRQDATEEGVTAFVRIENASPGYTDARVRISDGSQQVSLDALIPAGQEQTYVLPFPGSYGPVFTATLLADDDFPIDNTRYFALARPPDRRIRWIGERNRYIEAALRACGPMTLVEEDEREPVDVTVVYNQTAPADVIGSILLVHAGLTGAVEIGTDEPPARLSVRAPDDTLLAGIDPFDFRVKLSPVVSADEEGTIVLTLGYSPFLYYLKQERRQIVLIAPDIMQSNLPLTVDFPVLIRNILAMLAPQPSPPTAAWATVGEPLPLVGYGTPTELVSPTGQDVAIEGKSAFTPQLPGIYTLTTDKGTYRLAANVDPAESALPEDAVAVSSSQSVYRAEQITIPLWPEITMLALLLLIIEGAMYHGWTIRGRRR